jgi:Beta-agarase/YXIM esterase-like, galactose-binding domain-like
MGMRQRTIISLLMLAVFSLIGLAGINLAQATMVDLYSFDFGSNTSPVQPGWLRVTNASLYSSQLGYGWDANLTATNLNVNPPEYPSMLRDFNKSDKDRTFEIDLVAGTYSIELYFYGNNNNTDNWTVYLGNSSTVLATMSGLPRKTEVTRQFDITMDSAGKLDLRFQADKGSWQINGIKVAQEVPVPPTFMLLGTGLLGLTLLRRGRRFRKADFFAIP